MSRKNFFRLDHGNNGNSRFVRIDSPKSDLGMCYVFAPNGSKALIVDYDPPGIEHYSHVFLNIGRPQHPFVECALIINPDSGATTTLPFLYTSALYMHFGERGGINGS